MYKKTLLFAFLIVTNTSVFSMNSYEGSGWNSDNEESRSPFESQQAIRTLINDRKLGPAGREASQLLRSIEENPHSSDSIETLEVIENIKGELLELASFKGQSNSPIFRGFQDRLDTVKATIRCPSASPARRSESKNEDEEIS